MNYFVQMSGVPGSGKSTLARALASEIPAIVLDHDDTKSAILESGVSESGAGAASYEVLKTLSSRILDQGYSVIVDSPCLYVELLEHGMSTASEFGANYKYIECVLADMNELDRRLRARDTKPSQIRSLDQMFSHAGAQPKPARQLVEDWAQRMVRPGDDCCQVDTTMPISACVTRALNYMVTNDR